MNVERRVDLLFLARNRLAFTRESFTTLLANTDWDHVRELVIMDDGSVDGTLEWLQGHMEQVPVPARLVRTRFNSPVAAMSAFIEQARAPILAKIDNDVIVPLHWLSESLSVLDRHPEMSLLGLEAIHPVGDAPDPQRGYAPADFVSGLGLYRRDAFVTSRPAPSERWFGFESWQAAQGPALVRGWIKPALPFILLDRLPFPPWSDLTAEYVRRGWQRPWASYDPKSTLWEWYLPPEVTRAATRQASPTPGPSTRSGSDPRVTCAMRVKNEAAYIGEALERALLFCQRALVLDDHSTDDTVAICQSFGDRVTVFPSPFTGLDEARDKNYLLREVIADAPDWVLWIDGDEVLERSGPEVLRREIAANPAVAVFSLRIAYLWNDPGTVRVDGVYGSFSRPSLFRLRGQPVETLHFASSGVGGNFHCGNVPRGLVGDTRWLDTRLKHYGYLTHELRLAKYRWYTTHDPNNDAEDHYRHLAGIPGARHAPGPPQFVPWVE